MALTQVKTSGIADDAVTEAKVANDAISPTEMKAGTDGHIITYDASGNPTTVGPGTDGQVLTSTGAGSPPAFEALPTIPTVSGSTNNTVCTVTGANAIQGESNVHIDGSGRILVGTTASRTVWGNHNNLQIEGLGGGANGFSITRNTNDASYPYMAFGKSRGTADGATTIVADNDVTGVISFNGADGGDMNPQTAYIQSAVDGTPGVNDMPGRLQFFTTADGAADSTERLRIDSSGKVGIGTTSPSDALEISHASDPAIRLHYGGNSGYSVVSIDSANNVKLDVDPTGAAANSNFEVRIDGADKLEVLSDGDVKITDGDLVIGTAGHGIDFSATSHYASKTSETLTDYEEGTWSPGLAKSGDAGVVSSLTDAVGRYVKIGKLLWISFYVYKSSGSFGSLSGHWYIYNLPFGLEIGGTSAYQSIPAGYIVINNSHISQNDVNSRWQSANTNGNTSITLYGAGYNTNWSSGGIEMSGHGVFEVD